MTARPALSPDITVIRDLFRQLHAVRHGTETLVYSNHPREAAASSYLALPIVTLRTIRPKDSRAARNATEFQY